MQLFQKQLQQGQTHFQQLSASAALPKSHKAEVIAQPTMSNMERPGAAVNKAPVSTAEQDWAAVALELVQELHSPEPPLQEHAIAWLSEENKDHIPRYFALGATFQAALVAAGAV